MRFITKALICIASFNSPCLTTNAQAQFINSAPPQQSADLTGLTRLRFLTTTDFFPFNYTNQDGQLNGYNVDLARALCRELKLENICQIEALPWSELQSALDKGEGEAIIAGLTPNQATRKKYKFSRPYLRFPARFIALNETNSDIKLDKNTFSKPVGLLKNSKHAEVFASYFPDIKTENFDDRERMMTALREKDIAAIFDDGLALSFLLETSEGHACCHFIGAPYYAPQLLNNQMTIAVGNHNLRLNQAFDNALAALEKKGALKEIYLRHFPVSFY
ncbi:transporter substrate-binding domain-containing protein [Brucellaceae bacterium C25G]